MKWSALFALFFAIGFSPVGKAAAQFRQEGEPEGTSVRPVPCSSDGLRSVPLEETFFSSQETSPQKDNIPGLEGEKVITRSHKNGFLAGILSCILPGLGEYYVGDQIWRGIILTVVDAGLWYGHFHYITSGNNAYTAFQNYSDTYWSPQRYADTLNSLLALAGKTYHISNANDFSQINLAEDSLRYFFANFSHNLPTKGSQDYYEVISKYIQFTPGWQDNVDGNPLHSAEYQNAANMRADMNHQFEVANDFLYGLILNRILSAIDAALLAKDHNSAIHLEGELRQSRYLNGMTGFIPTARMTYTF